MTQTNQTSSLIPLLVVACVVICTIFIHGMALSACVHFFRRERRLGRAGTIFWKDVAIVTLTVTIALIAHLIEIAVWAVLFLFCGEFPQFGIAYYHSAVNYTTLGYGDMVMSASWKLLGPMEAADGMLMFGISTALVFALIQRLIQTRFEDLRNQAFTPEEASP